MQQGTLWKSCVVGFFLPIFERWICESRSDKGWAMWLLVSRKKTLFSFPVLVTSKSQGKVAFSRMIIII